MFRSIFLLLIITVCLVSALSVPDEAAVINFIEERRVDDTVKMTAEEFTELTDVPLQEIDGKQCVDLTEVMSWFRGYYLEHGCELIRPIQFYTAVSPDSDFATDFTLVLVEDFTYDPDDFDIDEPTVENILKAVDDYMEYDIDYEFVTMQEAVNAHKGVCYHYAKLFEKLCRDNGIYCETVYGRAGGSGHAWNRVSDIWADPTWNDVRENGYPIGTFEEFSVDHTLYPYCKEMEE